MHKSSYNNMQRFVAEYLSSYQDTKIRIADIGAQEINESYRPIFDNPLWEYVGIDIEQGKNVDIVVQDIYNWSELQGDSFDVVISGQAFEHIEYFWITMLEIRRIMKPSGLCCIIAPSGGKEHRYPVDCWRFYPDGFKALAKYAALEVLDVYVQWDKKKWPDRHEKWQDCVLIGRKHDVTPPLINKNYTAVVTCPWSIVSIYN